MKKLFIIAVFLLASCGSKQDNDFFIKQEINENYLITKVIRENGVLLDYPYFNYVKIDSTTDVKKEYQKAVKVLNQYKKIENEIHNNNN